MSSVGRRPVSLLREAAPLVAASLLARGAFVWFKGSARSVDLEAWKNAGDLLARGRNPYAEPWFFVWPPLWVQILWVLQKVSARTGLSLIWIVPIFLVLVEAALILALVHLLRQLGYAGRRRLVLLGIAFNPVCIILVCQHGNFDVLVGLLVLLAIGCLVRSQRSQAPADWLLACLFVGLGIALKSVPVVLLPMLIAGSTALAPRIRALGAVLALGPAAYGLSILQVLNVARVKAEILGYRSYAGWFGVTGWLHRINRDRWIGGYQTFFTPLLAVVCVAFAVAALRNRLSTARALYASAAFLLAFLVALGPGYGPQYFYWSWPVLLVAFAVGSSALRRLVLGFGVVAAVTYAVEYAFAGMLGAFLAPRFPSTLDAIFGSCPACFRVFTLVRTPLWLGYLALLWGLAREISTDRPGGMEAEEAKPVRESAASSPLTL